MKKRNIVILLLAASLVMLVLAWAEELPGIYLGKGAIPAGRYIGPGYCADCHDTIHEEWTGSVHSLALQDPVYRAITQHLAATASTETEKHEAEMCVKCHAPAAFGAGQLTHPSQPLTQAGAVEGNSVFCDFCHTVTGYRELQNTSFMVSPGDGEDDPGVKRGPRHEGDAGVHESAYSDLHTRSEFCAVCHEVRHIGNGTPLETAYAEWLAGPYSTGDPATTVHCQDCHLRQAPGMPATGTTARPDRPGEAAMGGPERPHVWRHFVVGANAFLPAMFGAGQERAQMAYERLQNCASLKLWSEGTWQPGQTAMLKVKVSNDGAGHSIPTGVIELRQAWLQVEVRDQGGRLVYASGEPGADGALPADTVLYHMQLGDAEGNPTINIIKADRVLHDYRIPAGGFRMESFSFAIPADSTGKYTASVKLRYRSLPAEILKLLGDSAPQIPIVDMAVAELSI